MLWFESNGPHRHRRVAQSDSTPALARRNLRASLAARRRALTPGERAHAARLVARNADAALTLRAGQRLALYAALPHELDASILIELARARGCELYLPRIERPHSARGMRFLRLTGTLARNRLGIEEPQRTPQLGARWFNIVFLPLLGFDRRGVRLGTGGGYYDRAFAFRNRRTGWHAPLLVGLAHGCQEVPAIAAEPHDVRMDLVITEREVIRCSTG